jgi:endo-1,4-beta-xylanase
MEGFVMLSQDKSFRSEVCRLGAAGKFRLPSFAILAILLCVLGFSTPESLSQLAKGKGRFVGNALSSNMLIYADFGTYWDQVTPGNAGKWGSVEGTMGVYDWTWLDAFYNYALTNSFPFKEHCFIWGSQQPGWIAGLDSAQQRAKVEQWIDTLGARYPSMSMVDVVNEPFHPPPSYMHALGDTGKTGWDWIVTAFTWARQYCMHGTKLLINEYNVLQDNAVTTRYLALIDTLRVRGLIDAIGVQGHYFEFKSYAGAPSSYTYPVATLKFNLDRLAATGLPVYITEFDINEASDSIQLANYKIYFPLFWETPGVKGITLWGYRQGDMWKENAYLIRTNGSERPAMAWLRKYIASPLPPAIVSPVGTSGGARNPILIWHASAFAKSYRTQVSTTSGFSTIVSDTTVSDTTFQLEPLAANTRYYWRVAAANDSGMSSYSNGVAFVTGDQIVGVEPMNETPAAFALQQNFPNPFNPSTRITYDLPGSMHVKLSVYDVLGREVATLVNEQQSAGHYSVTFNAGQLPSGAYVYRIRAGTFETSRKLAIVK